MHFPLALALVAAPAFAGPAADAVSQSDSDRLIIWTLGPVVGKWKVADIMSDTSQCLLR